MAYKRKKRRNGSGNKGIRPDKERFRGTEEERSYDKGERNAANEMARKEGANDPNWYSTNEQLLKDAASLAFGTPIGMRLNLDVASDFDFNNLSEFNIKNHSIPGIMRLVMAQTIGVSSDNTSAINIAARNLYSYVRHANSGSKNYDSPDLMMYVVGMSSVYAFYAFMVRAYGVLRTYSQVNRYLPTGLFQAMGLNFESFQDSMADFRYYINQFAVKLGAFAVPANLSYFLRCVWLYSNVFTDAQSSKCQLYITKPAGFYKFNELTEGEPGFLEWTNMGDNVTLSALMNFGDDMMARISQSEDFNIMSGDILKAFGDNLFRVGVIPEDYVVVPVYNEAVLYQIHNTTIMNNAVIPNITQDVSIGPMGGAILSQPYAEAVNNANLGTTRLLDCRTETPDPAVVMEATRNMVTTTAVVEGGITQRYNVNSCGADICVGANIYYFTSDVNNPNSWVIATDSVPISYMVNVPVGGTVTTEGTASVFRIISRLEKFDWHPYVNLNIYDSTDTTVTLDSWGGLFGDTDNCITVVEKDLRKMHDTAMLSMFSVPSMGALGMK